MRYLLESALVLFLVVAGAPLVGFAAGADLDVDGYGLEFGHGLVIIIGRGDIRGSYIIRKME